MARVLESEALSIQTSDACSNMITNIRELRLSVLDLFKTLADNGPDPKRIQSNSQENLLSGLDKLYHQQSLANIVNSHSLCSSSAPPPRIQRHQEQQQQNDLIQYVSRNISNITNIMRFLDRDVEILTRNTANINPSEFTNTSLAIESCPEKHNLYVDLCHSYKTFTKLHDYSKDCHRLLLQQSLKRVLRSDNVTSGLGGGTGTAPGVSSGGNPEHHQHSAQNQSQHLHHRPQQHGQNYSQTSRLGTTSGPITFNPYLQKSLATSSIVVKLVENCVKSSKCVEALYTQPFGMSTGVVQIGINRVLKAVLVMRGIMIDGVIVKAYHESFSHKATSNHPSYCRLASFGHDTYSGSYSAGPGSTAIKQSPFVIDDDDSIDIWTESRYSVFRKLTHHANAAILHFQYPTYPEIAVQTFLNWFTAYTDLFAVSCSRCNGKLRKFTPAICRDYGPGFPPYHESCR